MSEDLDQVAFSWVPFEETRTWDQAAAIAVDEAQKQGQARHVRPSIVSVDQNALHSGPDLIQRACRDWDYGTLRGKWPQSGPVLAWQPDSEVVHRAARTARGSALIVVEFPDQPVGLWRAWAAQVGATDLSTATVTPDPRSEQVKDDIRFVIWNGNNGWPPRDPITTSTVRYLDAVAGRGDLDEATYVAAAVIAGKSRSSLQRLRTMIAAAQAGHAQQDVARALPGEPPATSRNW